ncbi:MAG TPA: transporter substrate-binding protein [Pirellulales bacterium]|nr:transporter substrate-binding protein [Pirellulales bacterium]
MNDRQPAVIDEDEAASAPAPLADTLAPGPHTPPPDPIAAGPHSGGVGVNSTWPGSTLGRYLVTGVLGRGGMGVVLLARDPLIERDVAIKILADHLAADELALGRFLAEAKVAGKLNHPHVVSLYEICQEGARHFLVMEYVSGGSLKEWQATRGGCSPLEATLAMIDACKGIAAAHAAGLIHRDIKPANFLRTPESSIKVGDFGLAKAAASGASPQLTQAGLVVGTPFFMSPEQCQARPVDARSDIYSLGATYYALLTGRDPYDDCDSVPHVMYNHCHGPILDPRQVSPAVPAACAGIIARAMAKSPFDRYQSVGEMQTDLEAVAAPLSRTSQIALPSQNGGRATERSRRKLLAAAAAMFLVGAAGGGMAIVGSRLRRDAARPESACPLLAAPDGEPIKVGVLHSLTGTMANSETVVVDATLFAIEEINAAGGVLGRPVKAVVADGRSHPATFAREAERLIAEERVCTVFGCWTSSARKTVKPVFERRDHLLVYPVQYEGCETSPNIIYMGAAPNQQILPAIAWAVKTLGKRRFFLVGSDYVFPRTANAVIKDDLGRLGAEAAGEVYLPMGSLEVQSVVQNIVAAKPDMILNTVNGDSNTPLFRELRAAGVKPHETPMISFSVGEQELRSLNLADIEGDYAACTYFQAIDTLANTTFVDKFHETYPQRPTTDAMAAAYDGVKLWAQAVEEAQSLEPKKIRRAMLTLRFPGPGGEVRLDPDTQHCYKTPRIGRIRSDGQFEILWEAPAPVAPQPYPATRTAEAWRAFLHDLYASWGGRWFAP